MTKSNESDRESSHRKNKRAKFKRILVDEKDDMNLNKCSKLRLRSSYSRFDYYTSNRIEAKTFWTIVIAFMTTQIISLCDHTTSTSASSSVSLSHTGLSSSNNNRQASIYNIALAGSSSGQSPLYSTKQDQIRHQLASIRDNWSPSSANLAKVNFNNKQRSSHSQASSSHLNSFALSTASLIPQPENGNSQQGASIFHQITPISMYQQPLAQSAPVHEQNTATSHYSGSAPTSRTLQHSQQTQSSSQQHNSSPSSSSSTQQFDTEVSNSPSESNSGSYSPEAGDEPEKLIGSGTQESSQETSLTNGGGNLDQFQSARERCRELISLTLLSFKDLTPHERASEEIDCANLREQIAAASGRVAALNQSRRQQIAARQPATLTPIENLPDQSEPGFSGSNEPEAGAATQLPIEDFPLAPPTPLQFSANQRRPVPLATVANAQTSRPNIRAQAPISQNQPQVRKQQQSQPQVAQNSFVAPQVQSDSLASITSNLQQQQQQLRPTNIESPSQQFLASKWEPKNSYINQVQALLLQQQQQQQSLRQQENQNMLQFYQQLASVQKQHSQNSAASAQTSAPTFATTTTTTTTSTTQAPTTLATTFESLIETTTLPPSTTTTTTTTTTTAPPRANQPKIRIGAPPNGRRNKNGRQMRTSTTTTTTTTTQKPSTPADYADSGDVSTDYYDEYDDQSQQQTTTTTTTTQRPRGGRGRKQKRKFTSTTTPKPSTTTTTLSPGYQPRPDGRIIDYMADPNFPRELKGADLTNYPFYISVPEKIDFDCKGRHDGYYSNIDLHCQIYHHCAIGNRYDFLCPNYTLFDQTTFTCRFVNTVDCDGSTKHYDRNNALYVEKDKEQPGNSNSAASTTSTTTTTTTTLAPKSNTQLSRRFGQIDFVIDNKATVSSSKATSKSSPVLNTSSDPSNTGRQQRSIRTKGGGGGAATG